MNSLPIPPQDHKTTRPQWGGGGGLSLPAAGRAGGLAGGWELGAESWEVGAMSWELGVESCELGAARIWELGAESWELGAEGW